MVNPLLLKVAGVWLLALLFSCSSPTRYNASRETPAPPRIDSIQVSTSGDVEPCIKLFFSYSDTLPATFEIWRKDPSTGNFSRVVLGIPMQTRSYSDVAAMNLPRPNFFNPVVYLMKAVSPRDSISAPSQTDSIVLMNTSPQIIAIDTAGNHPSVTYQFDNAQGRGLEWSIELTKNDSVLSSKHYPFTYEDQIFAYHFLDISITELKNRAAEQSTDNGIYGIRIIATDKTAHAVGANYFRVKN